MDGLLESVVKFSNYITARLVVAGTFFYVMAGFLHLGNPVDGLLPNIDLVQSIAQNYETIFTILGVSDFAMLLIFFLFLTAIHLTYIAFDRVGHYIPPAIVPLPGWDAIEDMFKPAFDLLREARGEEHTDGENQRLFEFRRKLETIDRENERKHESQLEAVNAAFRISKSFVVFSILAWFWALISGDYTGDPRLLLVILAVALCTMAVTVLSITRENYERIEDLRLEVSHQLTGFTSIWCPNDYMDRLRAVLADVPTQPATTFKVLMPVYGTLDAFISDMRKLRRKERG